MDEQTFNEGEEIVQMAKTDQTEFKRSYEQLLAGVNRIRYLKTKQKINHVKMIQYLNTIQNNLISKKENQCQSMPKLNHSFKVPILYGRKTMEMKYSQSPYKNSITVDGSQTLRINTQPQKLFHYSFQAKVKNNCLESKPTETTMLNSSIMPNSNHSNRQKLAQLLLKKKAQNYQQMKKIKMKNQEEEKQNQQALLQAARIRKEAVRTSYENGRKRIHQQYFEHLESIKQAKLQEKERKTRLTQKKIQQLLQLQKHQKEQLQKYEHSLILQSNLKELIQKANKQNNSKLGCILKYRFQ